MATSLAQQLKRLAVPETGAYKQDKKKTSILFDPKEAASIDRETFYEIGLSGLAELKRIDPRFSSFEKNLFNISSKNFERSVQTSETNEKIDETIKNFLISLSPYFLLQASHKALEWTVNRYHIHKYNKDEFLSLILPYHETKIFVRCLQILRIDNSTERWNWLEPLQKPGIPLPKSALFNHCSSNPSFLKFIWNIVQKSLNVFQNQPEVLSTLYTFYCSTTIGALEHSTRISEAHITNILPGLLHTLVSSVEDLKAAGYMILAQLLSKVQLKSKILKRLISSILSYDVNIEYETVLILHLLFHTQENLTKVSESFLGNLSTPCMKNLCLNLSILTSENTDVSKFLLAFMSGALELLQLNVENLKRFNKLLEMLVSEVSVDSKTAELLIRCTVNSYSIKKHTNQDNGDDSDMEIVDEPDIEKITLWYSNFLKSFESKYPEEFDKVLKIELKQGENDTTKRISDVIGFAPKLVDKLGDTFLFEKLYHQNVSVRLEACKYLVDNFTKLQKKNATFLKESITDRLQDEDPLVVSTLLSINLESLFQLLDAKEAIGILKRIISRGSNDLSWRTAVSMSLNYICLLEAHVTDLSVILSILPYLFPNNENSLIFARAVLQSYFMDELVPQKITKKCLDNNEPVFISRTIFENLKESDFLPKSENDLITIISDDSKEDNYKYKVMALIILSLSLQKRKETLSTTESLKLLKGVNEFIRSCRVTYKGQYSEVTPKSISQVLETAGEGKFPLQVYTFFLSHLIRTTDTSCAYYKPWLLNTPVENEMEYISAIYEIILKGCTDKLAHIYSPLLETLSRGILKTNTQRDNTELIANYAISALTQENKCRLFNECDMIMIRSVRLVLCLVTMSNEDINWILTSDAVIMMCILALYSDIQCVRENTIDILNVISEKCDKKHFIIALFNELLSRKQEIILDHEQVPLILYNLLSPDNSVNKLLLKTLKTPMKKSLDYIINTVIKESTPFYVKSKICFILNHVNSGSILTSLSQVGLELLRPYDFGSCIIENVYKSLTLGNIISRIDSKTLKSSVDNESVWDMVCRCLKNHDYVIIQSDNQNINVSVLMMQQIDQSLFGVLSHQNAGKVLSFIIEAATFSKSTNVISTATKLLKKLELDDKQVSLILQAMLKICEDSTSGPRKRRSFVPPLSILETSEWKCGNTLLECVQSKKKLTGIDRILPLLFKVLKKCLEFEEQSPVEYTKQLVLTSILHCCQQLYPIGDPPTKPLPGGLIDVELIVMCIRGSQNPQTHHHALMLLSQAAYMIPDKVLHHIMAIFTFIGSSILRHDDAYSFQIITTIIDTVVPILVKSESTLIDEKKLNELEKRVVPVLRIFVDVALDIPEHRRLPLFKKLLETLNPEYFLWNFLCLLFESHIVHNHDDSKLTSSDKKMILNKEQPVRRLDFAMSVTHEFSIDVIMQSCIKLMTYLKSLPIDKPEDDNMKVDSNPSAIFSVSSHTAKELRHFKYTIVTYINNLLSSPVFTQQLNSFSRKNDMETLYKTFIVSILTYIQVVSKAADQNVGKPQGKYWKVMLHHSYEILDNVNALLPTEMFVTVVRGLMSHNLSTVRRKSMEILNTKLQHHASFFADCEMDIMYTLLDPLVDIITDIDKDDITEGLNIQELELNQQTALLSLKLLVRLLAQENPMKFTAILSLITNFVKSEVSSNLMASIVLCLAELCSNLKAHAIAFLPKFMPPLIKLLKAQNTSASSELVLLSIITAVYKIIDILPQFLSPYLEKLLYEFSILTAKWDSNDLLKKSSAVSTKLHLIRTKISSTIAPRVLIPVVSQCYSQLIRKRKLNAIGPAMQILAESFTGISSAEFTSLQQELTAFFLLALQFRNDYENELSKDNIDNIEDHVIEALVSLVLKLSESSFRPLYFKIYDWAVRLNNDDNKERTITFYRLSSVIAENLKGLFILFAGHFIKNAADLLDKCNKTKNTETFFESEDKCCKLIESIVRTLHPVFLHDTQNFVNKERFETIMQPLVDQLDNDVGGMDSLKTRARSLLIPCIAQFGIATADDSLWKPLNYQILLKTRHNDSDIRLLGLECMCEIASKLGESWLPLLPESVPFLAELLEDEVKEVESATQKAVQALEAVLGEPLQKYF